jgi:hypothetical protein
LTFEPCGDFRVGVGAKCFRGNVGVEKITCHDKSTGRPAA